MKNLILTLCFLFTTILFSQSKYEDFVGNWESDKTEYTLVISKHFAKDHFKFLNYKEVFKTTETGEQIVDIEYSEEEFVKVENEKIYTFVAWEYGDGTESYYCDLVYEKINKNKLKVTFTGSSNMVLYYKRKE
tara:strand:- start:1107 stop:1505 length:399 start_codon:yes stop_codon:yes gene_type:complete